MPEFFRLDREHVAAGEAACVARRYLIDSVTLIDLVSMIDLALVVASCSS
jgi:hypothetical protein